jgi:hypothetical protein
LRKSPLWQCKHGCKKKKEEKKKRKKKFFEESVVKDYSVLTRH